jgi:N-acetyl-alpha-D-muramate 1-phosphate uridylyltransferase
MKAMIFAAGFGTRLQPLTAQIPKVLVPVKGRPLLEWIIDHLSTHGISEFVINTHHLHEEIEKYLFQNPCRYPITLSYEPKILGTGGGLYESREILGSSDFMACNGDVASNADLTALLAHHRDNKPMATLAVTKRESASMLLVDTKGDLVGIQRNGIQQIRREPDGVTESYHFCGIHIISSKLLTEMKPPVEFSITDEYLKLLEEGIRISVWDINDAYWESIEDRPILERVNDTFPGLI